MSAQPVDAIVEQCSALLEEAERRRQPIAPLTDAHPGLTLAQAYAIQRGNVAKRLARGERVIGHKVGLTARTMQELFGVHEPDYGHLLGPMVHDGAVPLDLGELIDPQVEVEPAFVLARPLAGPGVTIADVIAATDYVSPSLEIIDSRIVNWRIRIQDTVADNGSSARLVLGPQKHRPADLDLGNLETHLELDDEIVETGNTSAVLGHPANGIAWLANTLATFGIGLEAGHIVLPGTCTRSRRIAAHATTCGRIAGLGSVSLRLAGQPTVRPQPAN